MDELIGATSAVNAHPPLRWLLVKRSTRSCAGETATALVDVAKECRVFTALLLLLCAFFASTTAHSTRISQQHGANAAVLGGQPGLLVAALRHVAVAQVAMEPVQPKGKRWLGCGGLAPYRHWLWFWGQASCERPLTSTEVKRPQSALDNFAARAPPSLA